VTLSTPVKVVALAGLVCILGALGLLALAARRHTAASTPLPLPVVHRATPQPAHPRVALDRALPAPLYRALERSRKVVAVLVSPGVAADRATLAGAAAGAREAGLPLVRVDVSQNAVAEKLATWLPGVGDPAVVVVRRPGVAVATLRGWSDAPMVAQVARNAVEGGS
jgi:hypothetical protein